MPEDKLMPLDSSGSIDISRRVDVNLYAMADRVVVEDELSHYDDAFFKQELAKDTEGLVYRPPLIGINHTSGTFDLSGAGVSDYSPSVLKVQIIDHARNRSLWRVKQDPQHPKPMCSSLDAIHGSAVMPDGTPVKCSKCVYGRWWEPAELLAYVNAKGPGSAPFAAYKYLNESLRKRNPDDSVEGKYKEDPHKTLPPCCKEVRRLFMFVYDHQNKGVLNQPAVIQTPTTSILNFDKYIQDISVRTVARADGRKVPLVLIAVLTSLSLEKIQIAGQTYSKVNFEYDKVAPRVITDACLQMRAERGEQVMSFQVQLSDFDIEQAVDPTSLEGVPHLKEEDIELPPTMELD